MTSMSRLKLNSLVSFLNRIVLIISSFVLPRLILLFYGSEINGLVSSVTQFLSVITFLDMGVGTVVQSALYRPLNKNDYFELSSILKEAKSYFNKIAFILVMYVAFLMIFYTNLTNNYDMDQISTAMLIFAISISQFGQYYFGIINELLLNADQKAYIQLSTEILVVLVNIIVAVVLITNNFSISFVKLVSGFIYFIRPLLLTFYVKKNYDLNYEVEYERDPLPQRWSGVGQHIAFFIQNNTDIIIITLFSTLQNVSIYTVYNLVAQGIRTVVTSFTTGIGPFFGNCLARDEVDELFLYFEKIEWVFHTIVTFLFGMAMILIVPFVLIYTKGIEDVNYYLPIFGILLVISRAIFTYRIPYQSLVYAAGHFKETERSSYIEAALNIIFSLVFIDAFGIIGVVLGSLVAGSYRLIYLAKYSENILPKRKIRTFLKQASVDVLTLLMYWFIGNFVLNIFLITNFIDWLYLAIVLTFIFSVISVIINLFFYGAKVIVNIKSLL